MEASTPQAVCKSISIHEMPGSMTTKSRIPTIVEKEETFDSVLEQGKAEISIEEMKGDPAFDIQVSTKVRQVDDIPSDEEISIAPIGSVKKTSVKKF